MHPNDEPLLLLLLHIVWATIRISYKAHTATGPAQMELDQRREINATRREQRAPRLACWAHRARDREEKDRRALIGLASQLFVEFFLTSSGLSFKNLA